VTLETLTFFEVSFRLCFRDRSVASESLLSLELSSLLDIPLSNNDQIFFIKSSTILTPHYKQNEIEHSASVKSFICNDGNSCADKHALEATRRKTAPIELRR